MLIFIKFKGNIAVFYTIQDTDLALELYAVVEGEATVCIGRT